jgi:cold-inducible RNA-binding protein
MGQKLYVGNLPYDLPEDELRTIFAAAGQVTSVRLITDRDTGRPKGFGFVEMSSDAEAQDAIQKLNGSSVGNRKIVVSEARPMEKRGGPGDFGGRH